MRVNFEDSATRLQLWGGARSEEPRPLYLGLSVALSEALRVSGLLPLHAAVAAHGDVAVAWLGPSGAGKSMTLLCASRAGWHAVAEDMCWLEPESLRVYGWDRGVRAWPDALDQFFPDLTDAAMMPDGKRFIPYHRLGADRARSCMLSHIAPLARDPEGRSRWESATAHETVKALWEATGLPLLDRSRNATARCVERLVRRVPAARLVWGDTELPLGDGGAGLADL